MAQKKKKPASAARKGEATRVSTKAPGAKVSAKTVQASASAIKKPVTVKSKSTPTVSQSRRATVSKSAPTTAKASALKAAAVKAPSKSKDSVTKTAAPARPAARTIPVVVPKAPASSGVRAMPAAQPKEAASTISAPSVPKDLAQKAVAARAAPQPPATQVVVNKKPVTQRHGFKTSEYIVYPAHGVGRIIGIEEQEIAGMSLELFVIQFEKDKLTLRVPTGKSQSIGMRKLSEDGVVQRAMDTLKGKARIKRTMWSRRAQEYEAKINSGDLVSIAEVVRDLFRAENQPEQSYSERQLYEAALDRMAREIAAVDQLDERGAVQRITEVLAKSAKGRRAVDEAADDIEEGSISAA